MTVKLEIKPEKPTDVANPLKPDIGKVSAQVLQTQKALANSTTNIGIGNEPLIEPIPSYIQAGCERVISHSNLNSFIVLGRDRPSDRLSGYGGSGVKRSAAIDIVVGRMGPDPRQVSPDGQPFWTDNNFTIDAARINISQRTNIDQNFKIMSKKAPSSDNCSGIGIKADSVRLIGRKDIKIVTGTDFYDSRGFESGVAYKVPYKISLIGDNRDDLLQPMVKGDNMMALLIEMQNTIHGIISTIETFLQHQNNINQKIMNHTHYSPFWGRPTTPSSELLFDAFPAVLKLLTDVKSSTMQLTGLVELNNTQYLYAPNDGDANTTNILSNYNFCN